MTLRLRTWMQRLGFLECIDDFDENLSSGNEVPYRESESWSSHFGWNVGMNPIYSREELKAKLRD